ncbi:L-serine ammonia-lyase, iron-sulfur-dependent subunit beta [Megasphaera sp. WILCCON 0056]|uniref:L-serine ammonia-lyase, iron-sulfur-dependent subunit beta n=1 Tax=Megasphaera sp. WILCCON 0056 TaxID=3345340 RepID=UPI003A7FCF42
MSILNIIGPIMIGPSSSHTAGAARIGMMARKILEENPKIAVITVYGSFAKTYRGHGTDKALVAGILGISPEDTDLRNSFMIAEQRGLNFTLKCSDEDVEHPNTVRIELIGEKGGKIEILGVSLGGGKIEIIEINGFKVSLSGEENTLITFHHDQPGIIAQVTGIMAKGKINVSTMKVFRDGTNNQAVMIVCTDSPIAQLMVERIRAIPAIANVVVLKPL